MSLKDKLIKNGKAKFKERVDATYSSMICRIEDAIGDGYQFTTYDISNTSDKLLEAIIQRLVDDGFDLEMKLSQIKINFPW